MQITPQILSIPPYLSTTWDNVTALKTEHGQLIVSLKSGETAAIPNLDETVLKAVFEAHAKYNSTRPISFSLPLKSDGGSIASLGSAMQHNPEQSDIPDIPPEILEKILMVTKAFGFEDFSALAPAEPDCNCTYCQIARSFAPAEKISDEDLHFRDWEINQKADKLYLVTSPLDPNEQYNVYLGEPLGCTCGNKNCEHIKAVLHS